LFDGDANDVDADVDEECVAADFEDFTFDALAGPEHDHVGYGEA
jgi:hypothetical protein